MGRPRGTIDSAEAKQLYEAKTHTISDLARRYHVGYDYMLADLRASGVELRRVGLTHISDREKRAICEAYETTDILALCKRFHHDPNTIKSILTDAGIQIRSQGDRISLRSNGPATNAWRAAAAVHYRKNGLYAVARLYEVAA